MVLKGVVFKKIRRKVMVKNKSMRLIRVVEVIISLILALETSASIT